MLSVRPESMNLLSGKELKSGSCCKGLGKFGKFLEVISQGNLKYSCPCHISQWTLLEETDWKSCPFYAGSPRSQFIKP